MHKVFLLSPANAGGPRGAQLMSPSARFDLAVRLRSPEGASLCELYTFMSSLYFRGKVAYAQRFASPPPELAGFYVIVPGFGLGLPDSRVSWHELRELATVSVDARNKDFVLPLKRDAERLLARMPDATQVVLLGSIATAKYVDPLLEVFGERLLFPQAFVGRGDMSRGGLMLQCVREGVELDYAPVASSLRRGTRATPIARMRTRRSGV